MTFKPFSDKYKFDPEVLIDTFPDYLRNSILHWLWGVLRDSNLLHTDPYGNVTNLDPSFNRELQIEFRELVPNEWNDFVKFTFSDHDRLLNFIAYCLQNYAKPNQAWQLERILESSSSAYAVRVADDKESYEFGSHDLQYRVDPIVVSNSKDALGSNSLLREAWDACYSKKPDYEKVISKACDFLEGFLGKKYFPKDEKPQLKKFVHAFEESPEMLSYDGDSIVNPKSRITDLLKEASDIRGQHTQGKGRSPTKEEARFVLHATVFIWNLHQQ